MPIRSQKGQAHTRTLIIVYTDNNNSSILKQDKTFDTYSILFTVYEMKNILRLKIFFISYTSNKILYVSKALSCFNILELLLSFYICHGFLTKGEY